MAMAVIVPVIMAVLMPMIVPVIMTMGRPVVVMVCAGVGMGMRTLIRMM